MKKDLKGLGTLETIDAIVKDNEEITELEARSYFYIPYKPTLDDENIMRIKRDDFLEGSQLKKFVNSQTEGWNVAVNSKVKLSDGTIAHIPMLDLAPRKSKEALRKIQSQLMKIIKPHFGEGYVLETGKSYHYIGAKIFAEKRLNEFLGRSLITSIVTKTPEEIPNIHEHIVDYRYVGYSLMRNGTGLRITTSGDKKFVPRVVAVI